MVLKQYVLRKLEEPVPSETDEDDAYDEHDEHDEHDEDDHDDRTTITTDEEDADERRRTSPVPGTSTATPRTSPPATAADPKRTKADAAMTTVALTDRRSSEHPMKNKRSLWVSLLSVVAIAVIALAATLAAGWSPKLGLDLDGGLAVVYQTHSPVNQAELDTIVTILNDRVNAGTSGATVASQGKNQISVSIPGEKNTQQILATLGNTAQLSSGRPSATRPPSRVAKGKKPSTGPLPTCAAATQLTAANLQVTPDSSNVNGYTSNTNIRADPSLRALPVDPAAQRQQGRHRAPARHAGGRFGPLRAGPGPLTGTAVKSASAQLNNGQWAVNLNLTSAGSADVGHPGQAAVPRHHRHRPRRPGHLRPHHPAHPVVVPRSTARCRSRGASPRTRPRPWPPTSTTAPCR